MSDYRPICDTWILARPKSKYYGAYPSGFLERARALLGVSYDDPVLHVCGGKVRDYPFRGVGPNDRTLDLDPALAPDFLMDARKMGVDGGESFPSFCPSADGSPVSNWSGPLSPTGNLLRVPNGTIPLWPAVLADPPYSADDAAHYVPGADALPKPKDLLARCLAVVRPGGRVGFLDYAAPPPPKKGVRLVALVGVIMGFGNKARIYSVYEKDGPNAAAERKRALDAVRGKASAAKLAIQTTAEILCDSPASAVTAYSSDGYCDNCGDPTTMKNRAGHCPKCVNPT